MDSLTPIVQFIHVLGGSAWLGGSLFANLVLVPFVDRQPVERQRDLVRTLLLGPERVMIGAALAAAITGVARGTLFGRIRSVESLATPYGEVWSVAVLIAIAVFLIGGRLTSPAAQRLRDDDALWTSAGRDANGPADDPIQVRASVAARLRLGFRLELLGIVVILGLMAILPTL